MTKKDLKWRLREAPTVEDITELLEQKIIDKEEARKLLFSENDKKLEELQEEIKFLRGLVDKLSSSKWKVIREYYGGYEPIYPTWYNRYINVITPERGWTYTTTGGTTLSTAGTTSTVGYINANVSSTSTDSKGASFSSLN